MAATHLARAGTGLSTSPKSACTAQTSILSRPSSRTILATTALSLKLRKQ